jgi:hypothetical protein
MSTTVLSGLHDHLEPVNPAADGIRQRQAAGRRSPYRQIDHPLEVLDEAHGFIEPAA